MRIRQETFRDFEAVADVIRSAFNQEDEVILVKNLRLSKEYIPELSLIALKDDLIIGHILFSKILIKLKTSETSALSLAPLSVRPEFQKKGVGSKLIEKGLEVCKKKGFKVVCVLGNENYYLRFGFRLSTEYDIYPPNEEWNKHFFVKELIPDSLGNVKGKVIFPSEFGEF